MKSAWSGALRVPVQIVFESGHTSESYVSQEGWHDASIERCAKCSQRIPRHGTYKRKVPDGTHIARFYCRPCHLTVSLLPHFLAAGYSDTLDVQEQVVTTAAAHSTFDAAAVAARPDIELQGARRWLRRRVKRYALTLLLAATALGATPDSVVVFSLRDKHPQLIRQLPTPVGLSHRRLEHWQPPSQKQQPMGPDPPIDAELRPS